MVEREGEGTRRRFELIENSDDNRLSISQRRVSDRHVVRLLRAFCPAVAPGIGRLD